MTWKRIPDDNIRHVWGAAPDDDCDENTEPVFVSPDWYADNGTPICLGCGEDMVYICTEISKHNDFIADVSTRYSYLEIEERLKSQIDYMIGCVQDSQGTIDPSEDINEIEITLKVLKHVYKEES